MINLIWRKFCPIINERRNIAKIDKISLWWIFERTSWERENSQTIKSWGTTSGSSITFQNSRKQNWKICFQSHKTWINWENEIYWWKQRNLESKMLQSSKRHKSSTKLMIRCWNWWRKNSLPSRVSQINSHLNRAAMWHMTQNHFWLLWNERRSQKSKRKPKWKSSWGQRWKRQISRLAKALRKNINSDQKWNCSWNNKKKRIVESLDRTSPWGPCKISDEWEWVDISLNCGT